MNAKQKREVAIRAVRSECRRHNEDPKTVDEDKAIRIIDDMCISTPNLIVAQWYNECPDSEIEKFKKEWTQQTQE